MRKTRRGWHKSNQRSLMQPIILDKFSMLCQTEYKVRTIIIRNHITGFDKFKKIIKKSQAKFV